MARKARELGALVKELIMSDPYLAKTVKVYPEPALEGTAYPYITYEIPSIATNYTKDGLYEESTAVDVRIYTALQANGYEQKISIANACESVLQGKRGSISGFSVSEIRRSNESEASNEGFYVQQQTYGIKLNH